VRGFASALWGLIYFVDLAQDLGEELAIATTRYRKEMLERKKLHNIIQELKGNIRVYMRCRPPTRKEIEQFGTGKVGIFVFVQISPPLCLIS
jgi:kinesin family protein C2/C3